MSQLFSSSQQILQKFGSFAIESFDIFGKSPNLRILQKKKYTSGLGCCMTFIIGSATLAYLITQILTLYSKSQPRLVISEEQIFDSTAFPLFNDNYTLAVTIANKDSEPILGQLHYYNITISHCVRQRVLNILTNTAEVNLNCTQLPIDACKETDFDNDLQKSFFKSTRLGVVQCIDRETLRNHPPVLQGQISGSLYQYLIIEMSICRNTSTYQGCAPIEEIKSVLSAGHYSVYASDYLMQLNHPDNPYQQFINLDINSFSISTSKMLQWTYRIQETHTDDGIFFSNDNLIMNLRKQDRREQTELYNNDYLVYHYIQLDYIKTINQRSYIKMQTILSQVGGFWQIFIILATTILQPLINGLMTISIANELYRFKPNPKERKLDKIKSEDLEAQQISLSNLKAKSSNEKLSSNLFQSILLLAGCPKQKSKIFETAKLDIMKKLDIVKIIQKIQEMDQLKYILLSEEQLQLFDLRQKQLIYEDSPQCLLSMNNYETNFALLSSSRKQQNQKSEQKKITDYYLSFAQVSKQLSRASVDEKLLQMIDKDILSLFEQFQIQKQKSSNISYPDPFSKVGSMIEPHVQSPR